LERISLFSSLSRHINLRFYRLRDWYFPFQRSVFFILAQSFKPDVMPTLTQTAPKRDSRRSAAECREGPNMKVRRAGEPVPLRGLLVYPVVISISNYVCLAFLNISLNALLPLFLAMPLEIGGLNLSPPIIGYIIGSYGAASAIFQAIYFASIVRRWGERRVFIAAMSTFLPVFLLLPLINFVARGWGQLSIGVCILVGILLIMIASMDLAYGT
jgi:hypothetical protein